MTDLDVRMHRIFYNKISFKVCAAYFSSDINVQGEREVCMFLSYNSKFSSEKNNSKFY